MWAWLAGGPVLVEEKEGEGGGLVVGVEAEDGVEAAAFFLDVLGVCGKPEPGTDHEECGAREVSDCECG